jgi:hypothetical protein
MLPTSGLMHRRPSHRQAIGDEQCQAVSDDLRLAAVCQGSCGLRAQSRGYFPSQYFSQTWFLQMWSVDKSGWQCRLGIARDEDEGQTSTHYGLCDFIDVVAADVHVQDRDIERGSFGQGQSRFN